MMPYGLTNASATFQSLMNEIFKPFLRSLVLVFFFFFNDILVYNPDLSSHFKHIETVFRVLQQQRLFAKKSKCSFLQRELEYLGAYHFS